MSVKFTTPQIIDRLRKRYPESQGAWANVVEFQNIDFMAVATWMSKGYVVHGHEIKASRSDWLRELKKPHKATFSMARCDFWWLAAPKGVAKPEEIPHGWGFMELGLGGFSVVLKAPRLRPALDKRRTIPGEGPNPEFFNRESFAMLARRYAYSTADRDALLDGIPEPRPYLDAAAMATGRATSDIVTANKEFAKRQAKYRKEERDRIHELLLRRGE